MSRCKSCDNILTRTELEMRIILPDGSWKYEDFCTSCLNSYVYQVEKLETEEYQFQHLTDPKYKYFTVFEE